MTRVDGYSAYQSSYYQEVSSRSQGNKAAASNKKQPPKTDTYEKSQEAEKAGKSQKVELSDRAKKLLEKLQKKYGNMDFIIANYESDEEAARYLSGGRKEYSVLIDPALLEEMAADEDTEKQYTDILDNATKQIASIKDQLGEEGKNVKSLGFTVSKDGTVSFFAELEKASEKQRERIEKSREDRKAEAKLKDEQTKRAKIKAETVEELLEKIKNLDWDNILQDEEEAVGSHINYTA